LGCFVALFEGTVAYVLKSQDASLRMENIQRDIQRLHDRPETAFDGEEEMLLREVQKLSEPPSFEISEFLPRSLLWPLVVSWRLSSILHQRVILPLGRVLWKRLLTTLKKAGTPS
jgi:hypothetical protein